MKEQEAKDEEDDDEDQKVVKNLPFMEVNSYFGEFELIDKSYRQWTVIAKKECTTYTIPRDTFIEIFTEPKRRDPFLRSLKERLNNFLEAEKKCKKGVKKFDKPKKKKSRAQKILKNLNPANWSVPFKKKRNSSESSDDEDEKPKISMFNPFPKNSKKSKISPFNPNISPNTKASTKKSGAKRVLKNGPTSKKRSLIDKKKFKKKNMSRSKTRKENNSGE